VLLSGVDNKSASTQETSARADAYLSKPVRPEVLTDCLARLLQ
jgi:CheY-like chemotaxis protein